MREAAERVSGFVLSGQQWLESRSLPRIGRLAARRFHLPPDDLDDLLQELRLAVLRAGVATPLNATWIFRAAEHRALDLRRGRDRIRSISGGGRLSEESGGVDRELLGLLRARASLLPREAHLVYQLVLAGHSEREIAGRLGSSRAAVRRHIDWCVRFFAGRARRPVAGRMRENSVRHRLEGGASG